MPWREVSDWLEDDFALKLMHDHLRTREATYDQSAKGSEDREIFKAGVLKDVVSVATIQSVGRFQLIDLGKHLFRHEPDPIKSTWAFISDVEARSELPRAQFLAERKHLPIDRTKRSYDEVSNLLFSHLFTQEDVYNRSAKGSEDWQRFEDGVTTDILAVSRRYAIGIPRLREVASYMFRVRPEKFILRVVSAWTDDLH
jgi:hypothetical protein